MKEIIQINEDALQLRKELGEDSSSPIDIFSLLGNQSDLTVVFNPMSDNISGMSIKDDTIRLIAINSRLSFGRQRFTAAHELCHLYFHDFYKIMICSKNSSGNRDDNEKEADQFASYFLAPYGALQEFIDKTLNKKKQKLLVEDIVKIEQYFRMSRQAILTRLQSENLLSAAIAEHMKRNIINSAIKLGYDDTLYKPSPENKKYLTIGSYIKVANDLLDNNKISSGKYEELLIDAFRYDILYGQDDVVEQYD